VRLDDDREPPVGWIWARTHEETIDLLKSGRVDRVSLAHDLELATAEAERTGYDVVRRVRSEVRRPDTA
jgi:hypothetical protein